jgi:hypothetical protein
MAGEFSSFGVGLDGAVIPTVPLVPDVPVTEPEGPLPPLPPADEDEVVEVISAGLAVQLDEVSDTVTYLGKAQPGSTTAAGVWQIQRITTIGEDLIIEWANGSSEFNQVWDNRLSFSYY